MLFGFDPSTSSIDEFAWVLSLTTALIIVRFLRRRNDEAEHIGNQIDWFVYIFIPFYLSIAAINELNLSLFWWYFPYVIGGVFWVSIAVYNAYHNPIGWSKNYLNLFIIFVVMIAGFGIFVQLGITDASEEQLYPWLHTT